MLEKINYFLRRGWGGVGGGSIPSWKIPQKIINLILNPFPYLLTTDFCSKLTHFHNQQLAQQNQRHLINLNS